MFGFFRKNNLDSGILKKEENAGIIETEKNAGINEKEKNAGINETAEKASEINSDGGYPVALGEKENEMSLIEVLQEKLTDLDVKDGLMHCVGLEETYTIVLQMQYDGSEKAVNNLLEAREKKDFKNYAIYAHAIKGTCLNMGAKTMAELAKELEFAGKELNIEVIEGKTDAFVAKYGEFIGKLGSILRFKGVKLDENIRPDEFGKKKTGEVSAMEGLDKRDLKEDILKLKKAIEEYDIATASALLQSVIEGSTGEDKARFEKISTLLDNMDMDSIESELNGF